MAVYYADIDYTIHAHTDVKHRLMVEEVPDIPNNRSELTMSIIRTNTGSSTVDGGREAFKYTVNGTVIKDFELNVAKIPAGSSIQVGIIKTYIPHDASGNAAFTVSASYKCDYWEGWGAFSQFWTRGSASLSAAATEIDQSYPTISNFNISGNRYGLDVSASFKAAHGVYSLSEIVLEVWGMTKAQAQARVGKITKADQSAYFVASGSYGLRLRRYNNMSDSMSLTFDLDAVNSAASPLNSGGSYPYSLTVTALNGKRATISGTLKLPQKVTGITSDSSIDIIKGETAQISYFVNPSNAELQTVTFLSSDTDTASVDKNGVITANGDGICTITVKTDDGGFTAETVINVVDTSKFPTLNYFTRYLSVVDASKIIFACTFLHNELTEYGATVPELITISLQGKSQPIKTIKGIFEDIETNCNKLRSAAVSAGLSIESIPEIRTVGKHNFDWISIVNGWIDLLNEIHFKINGGG